MESRVLPLSTRSYDFERGGRYGVFVFLQFLSWTFGMIVSVFNSKL